VTTLEISQEPTLRISGLNHALHSLRLPPLVVNSSPGRSTEDTRDSSTNARIRLRREGNLCTFASAIVYRPPRRDKRDIC